MNAVKTDSNVMACNIYKHIENNPVMSFFVNFKDLQVIPLQLCSLCCFSGFEGIPLSCPDFRRIFFYQAMLMTILFISLRIYNENV